MGVLTIMRLGVFVAAGFMLIFAIGWILVYCPTISTPKNNMAPIENTRIHVDIEDYFNDYEGRLDVELKNLEKKKPLIFNIKENPKKENVKSYGKVVIPYDLFADDVFDSMVKQLHHPALEGYEKLISANNVTINRKPKEGGLYEYKLYADLPNAPPDMIMEVFLNNDYRKEWDTYITDLFFVQKNKKGPDVLYFNVDFPWPLANRDYVYAREKRVIERDGKTYHVIVMHSVLEHSIPEKKGVIRVNNYHQLLVAEETPWGGTFAHIYYYDDPKGSIPSWLINWAAKTGVPGFLNDIQRACKGYPAFLSRQKDFK